MGFCRRCGDIVAGTRCKCGGTAVAPAVAWNSSSMKEGLQDRWSNTYVTKDRPQPGPLSPNVTGSSSKQASTSNDVKRFPRPANSAPISSTSALSSRVSEHIASTTSQLGRPLSPLKQSVAAPEAGILPSPSPFDNSLSKVYGSVLQPKETLNTHSCSICHTIFPPDATIYPDPSVSDEASPGFVCRPCYATNGGSKGICPTCSRPVLALKSEGGFIFADGKYWHKRSCFICQGCFKNVGHAPMVDLLGRPTCAECFENCLKRDRTPKKSRDSISSSPMSNLGGMNVSSKNRSREGSPAIEELEHRLGIRSREASPSLEDSFSRSGLFGSSPSPKPRPSSGVSGSPSFHSLSPLDRRSPERPLGRHSIGAEGSPSPSPRGKYDRFKNTKLDSRRSIDLSPSFRPLTSEHSPSRLAEPNPDAVQEMKNRFMTSDSSIKLSSPPSSPLKHARSSGSFSSLPNSSPKTLGSFELPSTPDLLSDVSDAGTFSSSGLDSPPRNDLSDLSIDRSLSSNRRMHKYASRYSRADPMEPDDAIPEETSSQLGSPARTSLSGKSTPASTPSRIPVPHRLSTSHSPKPLTVTTNQISQSAVCAKCSHSLFSVHGGGRFVTVPNADDGTKQTFHADCFTCAICDLPFREASQGQAVFVKTESGACHVECAPAKIITRTISTPSPSRSTTINSPSSSSSPRHQASTSSSPRHQASASSSPKPQSGTATYGSSSRYERPPLTAPATSASFPRFGSSTSCPGCRKSVSPMERGVVPGPQGTRWHAPCLVCGGKKEIKGYTRFRDEKKKKDEPGCGKRLDSAAKTDGEGGVWCRECLLLLSNEPRGSPHGSPTRPLSMTSFGDGPSKILPQNTGTTTIARQFTGLGAGGPNDGSLRRQLTGGALGPTRSLSPTKQVGMGTGMRPRPKSVIGMRSSKSVDEGRGMFLVRQMTGSGAC